MKHKILVTDKLSEKGLSILTANKDMQVDEKIGLSPEELKTAIKGYDAILIRSATTMTKEIIECADTLKVIGRAGVGVDNVDVEAASKKGIVVMNAPSGNTLSTAELTISMILSLARSIPQANASMKQKKWDRKSFMGVELAGKTLGIIGLGRIGREVAKRMLSFGMSVIAYDPYAAANTADLLGIKITGDMDAVFAVADFITIHTPLTDETRNVINEKNMKKMKKGVRLVNCARGGLINEDDLVKMIQSGHVAGAALDVFDQEPPVADSLLYALDNVIMTPHVGASTKEAQENVAIDVANQVVDMLKNHRITNAVNYLQVSPEVYARIKPFLGLAEKMGSFLGSLKKGRHQEVVVHYYGELAELETAPLTVAVLKGLLQPILETDINDVNASVIAKERGIKVVVKKVAQAEDFAALISVVLKMEDGSEVSVAGTTFGKNDVRIVRVDGYRIDLKPVGYALVCRNIDKPGFVGRIGSVLGQNKINIANMTLGRKTKGDEAVTVFNIDDAVSDKVLDEIKKIENIVRAVVVNFGPEI